MNRGIGMLAKRLSWCRFGLFWDSAGACFTTITLSMWLFVALISTVWTPYALLDMNGYQTWQAPSLTHWLGTDGAGADMLSWLMAGSWTELVLVVATVLLAFVVGFVTLSITLIRITWVRSVALVTLDALIAIPTVLLAMLLAVPMGSSALVIVLSCGIGYGLNLARIVRPRALLSLQSDYVTAAIVHGASHWYCLRRHVLANVMPITLVQLSLASGTVILAESGLTYLGIGIPSGVASWGRVLTSSLTLIHVHPLAVIWPGLVVTLVVLALNMAGDLLVRVFLLRGEE